MNMKGGNIKTCTEFWEEKERKGDEDEICIGINAYTFLRIVTASQIFIYVPHSFFHSNI